VPQFEGLDPGAGYVSRDHPRAVIHTYRAHQLEVSCGTGDNKHKEVLTFVVASFDIGVQLHPRETFSPEVHGGHPHYLRHIEDA
jgi:hypothetical protein